MSYYSLLVLLFTFALWTDLALSQEIRYEEIRALVTNSNKKSQSLNFHTESARLRTGFLGRSFIPDVGLFAGQEAFNSAPLGAQNTNFFGINAKANIFNGMSDYWEEERRESQYQFQKVENKKTLNDIVFAAQESYLKISEMKSLIKAYTEGLEQLKRVESKVSKKVRSGVIAPSDLTSISLVKVGFEDSVEQINRNLVEEINKLSVLLGKADLNLTMIGESVMDNDSISDIDQRDTTILQVQMLKVQTKIRSSEAKSVASKRLPSLDLFANYARVPFSSREFPLGPDRMEWQAGVQASWKIGDFFEKSREAASLRAKSSYLEKITDYKQNQLEQGIDALIKNLKSLMKSISGISNEIDLSKNYYTQISAEYLRGVKSTSDLTTAFNQLLFLKQRRLNLIVQFHLSKAEVERLTKVAN